MKEEKVNLALMVKHLLSIFNTQGTSKFFKVTRVRSQGSIKVIFNVNMMDLRTMGYDNGTGSSITTNAATQANTTLNMTANTPR